MTERSVVDNISSRLRARKHSPIYVPPVRSVLRRSVKNQDTVNAARTDSDYVIDSDYAEREPTKLFLCCFCDKKFITKGALVKHGKRKHKLSLSPKEPMKCEYCSKQLSNATLLLKHLVNKHGNKYFACVKCSIRFKSRPDLNDHESEDCRKPKQPKRTKTEKREQPPQRKINVICRIPTVTHRFANEDKNYINETDIDFEESIATNVILPSGKSNKNIQLSKNAVIILDDIQWAQKTINKTVACIPKKGIQPKSLPPYARASGETSRREYFRFNEEPRFERCYDTNFYIKVPSNVHDNLKRFLDGSFNQSVCDDFMKTRKSKNNAVINTIEGFPTIITNKQYHKNTIDDIPRNYTFKHKWNDSEDALPLTDINAWKNRFHLNNCIVGLVSRLDILTQLTMRRKYEVISNNITPPDSQQKILSQQLSEIIDYRDTRKVTTKLTVPLICKVELDRHEGNLEFPFMLGLRPVLKPIASDKAELSGEWTRKRCYVCCACGHKSEDRRHLASHYSVVHPHAQLTYYEIVGDELLKSDIVKHLYIPAGKSGSKLNRPSRGSRACTKCDKIYPNKELHSHILECAGDNIVARRKCRYRPFNVRKRRARLPDNTIRKRFRKDLNKTRQTRKRKLIMKKRRGTVGDAESIKKMITNLPPKRHRAVLVSGSEYETRSSRRLRVFKKSERRNFERISKTRKQNSGQSTQSNDVTPNVASDEKNRTQNIEPKIQPSRKAKFFQNKNEAITEASSNGNNDSPDTSNIKKTKRRIFKGASAKEVSTGNERKMRSYSKHNNDGQAPAKQSSSKSNVPLKHSIASLTSGLNLKRKKQTEDLDSATSELYKTTQSQQEGQSTSTQCALYEKEVPQSKLDKPPLPSPLLKFKQAKPKRGLNDCIAMLKGKLEVPPESNSNKFPTLGKTSLINDNFKSNDDVHYPIITFSNSVITEPLTLPVTTNSCSVDLQNNHNLSQCSETLSSHYSSPQNTTTTKQSVDLPQEVVNIIGSVPEKHRLTLLNVLPKVLAKTVEDLKLNELKEKSQLKKCNTGSVSVEVVLKQKTSTLSNQKDCLEVPKPSTSKADTKNLPYNLNSQTVCLPYEKYSVLDTTKCISMTLSSPSCKFDTTGSSMHLANILPPYSKSSSNQKSTASLRAVRIKSANEKNKYKEKQLLNVEQSPLSRNQLQSKDPLPNIEQPLRDRPVSVDRPLSEDRPLNVDHSLSVNRPLSVDRSLSVDRLLSAGRPLSVDRPQSVDQLLNIGRPLLIAEQPAIRVDQRPLDQNNLEMRSQIDLIKTETASFTDFHALSTLAIQQDEISSTQQACIDLRKNNNAVVKSSLDKFNVNSEQPLINLEYLEERPIDQPVDHHNMESFGAENERRTNESFQYDSMHDNHGPLDLSYLNEYVEYPDDVLDLSQATRNRNVYPDVENEILNLSNYKKDLHTVSEPIITEKSPIINQDNPEKVLPSVYYEHSGSEISRTISQAISNEVISSIHCESIKTLSTSQEPPAMLVPSEKIDLPADFTINELLDDQDVPREPSTADLILHSKVDDVSVVSESRSENRSDDVSVASSVIKNKRSCKRKSQSSQNDTEDDLNSLNETAGTVVSVDDTPLKKKEAIEMKNIKEVPNSEKPFKKRKKDKNQHLAEQERQSFVENLDANLSPKRRSTRHKTISDVADYRTFSAEMQDISLLPKLIISQSCNTDDEKNDVNQKTNMPKPQLEILEQEECSYKKNIFKKRLRKCTQDSNEDLKAFIVLENDINSRESSEPTNDKLFIEEIRKKRNNTSLKKKCHKSIINCTKKRKLCKKIGSLNYPLRSKLVMKSMFPNHKEIKSIRETVNRKPKERSNILESPNIRKHDVQDIGSIEQSKLGPCPELLENSPTHEKSNLKVKRLKKKKNKAGLLPTPTPMDKVKKYTQLSGSSHDVTVQRVVVETNFKTTHKAVRLLENRSQKIKDTDDTERPLKSTAEIIINKSYSEAIEDSDYSESDVPLINLIDKVIDRKKDKDCDAVNLSHVNIHQKKQLKKMNTSKEVTQLERAKQRRDQKSLKKLKPIISKINVDEMGVKAQQSTKYEFKIKTKRLKRNRRRLKKKKTKNSQDGEEFTHQTVTCELCCLDFKRADNFLRHCLGTVHYCNMDGRSDSEILELAENAINAIVSSVQFESNEPENENMHVEESNYDNSKLESRIDLLALAVNEVEKMDLQSQELKQNNLPTTDALNLGEMIVESQENVISEMTDNAEKSLNAQRFEGKKSSKESLNTEEELFFECCEMLKDSSFNPSRNNEKTPIVIEKDAPKKAVIEPKNIQERVAIEVANEVVCTVGLGMLQEFPQGSSEDLVENLSVPRKTEKDTKNQEESLEKSKGELAYPLIYDNMNMFEDKFDKIKRKSRSRAVAAWRTCSTSNEDIPRKNTKKKKRLKTAKARKDKVYPKPVLTKGALKGFESFKVSISTTDLNLPDHIQNKSNQNHKSNKKSVKASKTNQQTKLDVYEFMDNESYDCLDMKVSKFSERVRNSKPSNLIPKLNEHITSENSDVDDFVYMSEADYVTSAYETETSQISTEIYSHKRKNNFKKKSIKPKNSRAIKTKLETNQSKDKAPATDLDQLFDSLIETKRPHIEEKKPLPTERAKVFNSEVNMGVEEEMWLDKLTDSLSDEATQMGRQSLDEKSNDSEIDSNKSLLKTKKKYSLEKKTLVGKIFKNNATRKSSRVYSLDDTASASSINLDAVFDSLIDENPKDEAKKNKKNKKVNPSQMLEHLSADDKIMSQSSDVFDDNFDLCGMYEVGVATHKARRKCAVGKQNVLAETWSSESDADSVAHSNETRSNYSNKKKRTKKGSKSKPKSSTRPCSTATEKVEKILKPNVTDDEEYVTCADEVVVSREQHGWIVGDSHKKLVTMLAHAKGRK